MCKPLQLGAMGFGFVCGAKKCDIWQLPQGVPVSNTTICIVFHVMALPILPCEHCGSRSSILRNSAARQMDPSRVHPQHCTVHRPGQAGRNAMVSPSASSSPTVMPGPGWSVVLPISHIHSNPTLLNKHSKAFGGFQTFPQECTHVQHQHSHHGCTLFACSSGPAPCSALNASTFVVGCCWMLVPNICSAVGCWWLLLLVLFISNSTLCQACCLVSNPKYNWALWPF